MQFLKKIKNSCWWLVAVSLVAVMLCGCSAQDAALVQDHPSELTPQIAVTKADTATGNNDAVVVDLDTASDLYKITEPGWYYLSGALEGTIEIDAEDQVVHLILGGVDVKSVSGPALQVTSAGKVILTLQEGTENTFRDSASYPKGSDMDACIYSTCDLTINGAGTLNVSGYYQDAIHTKDVLKVLGGTVFTQAKQDGMQGNDGILVTCQSLTVQSERNGLYTTKVGKPAKGNVEIYGGDHSVIAGGYGISAAADLYVQDCQLYIMGVLDTYQVAGNAFVAEEPHA